MSELAVHLFPMLADDELEELAADIKGLLQPIVLDSAR